MRRIQSGLLLLALIFQFQTCSAVSSISYIPQEFPDGTNYNVNLFILQYSYDNDSDFFGLQSATSSLWGDLNIGLVTIPAPFTNNGVSYMPLGVYTNTDVVPADVLFDTEAIILTNCADGSFNTNTFRLGNAQFINWPQDQSAFVRSTVTIPSLAYHTSGYQWQKDGANLMDDGHFIGVTNATLVITNVQLADAGDYTVVANHPYTPASAGLTLKVFKPINLGMMAQPTPGTFDLMISNQDGSAFEPERVPNLQVYSTTNLSLDISQWNVETNSGVISNGILQINFQDLDGNIKFWRVVENSPAQ